MIEDKYIGLGLAISSSLAIGTSFIITKKGLMDAGANNAYSSEDYSYLRNPIWWAGMGTMVVGEVANFAAYTFAPAILVTPLGALSVLIGSVLAAVFLQERLGRIGKIGCALCLIGSIVIVLHAPADKEVETVDEILQLAVQPGFLFYCFFVLVFALVMIYRVAPRYGKENPLVYISICSTVGSISVMAIKAFGIALKLTLSGNNQLTHPSTYVFGLVVIVCILTQMNYFNKALDQFDTSLVNPIYYVTFTTATLLASFLLDRGFNTTDVVSIISLLCGFLIIFSGVYLLNVSRMDPDGSATQNQKGVEGMPLDGGITSFQTRRSIQFRRSNSLSSPTNTHSIHAFGEHRRTGSRGYRPEEGSLMSDAFDEHDEDDENSIGLRDMSATAARKGSNNPSYHPISKDTAAGAAATDDDGYAFAIDETDKFDRRAA